ncbi:endonuclease domain-containing protein [Streptosporangium sp. NPDC001559]|uniref:endonuclease domain-containing protein n=1 Tax=Streptosporangium sp. NPDC001559 TaxID=3366187 RepID=UPI0036EA3ED8
MAKFRSPSVAERATFTLPAHETCNHRNYMLSCEVYEQMLKETGQRCEICQLPASENSGGKLFIDHEARRGAWAVRGLICNRCNTILGKDGEVPRNEAFANYLKNSWYRREFTKRGVSLEGPPQPPEGSKVQDAQGRFWTRRGIWWSSSDPRCKSRRWHELVVRSGPLGLTVVRPTHLVLHVDSPMEMAEQLLAHMLPEHLDKLAWLLAGGGPAGDGNA